MIQFSIAPSDYSPFQKDQATGDSIAEVKGIQLRVSERPIGSEYGGSAVVGKKLHMVYGQSMEAVQEDLIQYAEEVGY